MGSASGTEAHAAAVAQAREAGFAPLASIPAFRCQAERSVGSSPPCFVAPGPGTVRCASRDASPGTLGRVARCLAGFRARRLLANPGGRARTAAVVHLVHGPRAGVSRARLRHGWRRRQASHRSRNQQLPHSLRSFSLRPSHSWRSGGRAGASDHRRPDRTATKSAGGSSLRVRQTNPLRAAGRLRRARPRPTAAADRCAAWPSPAAIWFRGRRRTAGRGRAARKATRSG